ncbi:MAG: hypothetical protein GX847_06805, partial [Clostridiales bacterium]|nr:hypothetical protein [Clostridiales bacterium]
MITLDTGLRRYDDVDGFFTVTILSHAGGGGPKGWGWTLSSRLPVFPLGPTAGYAGTQAPASIFSIR